MKPQQGKKSLFQDKELVRDIINILNTKSEFRDAEHVRKLSEFIRNTEIFGKVDEVNQLINLWQQLKVLLFKEEEVVFHQDDVGNSFYIILAGSVKGYVKSVEVNEIGKKVNRDKEIFTLKAGKSFGDVALLKEDSLRTCTIKASQDNTFLIELTKKNFHKFVGEYITESVAMIVNYFNECELFKDINPKSKRLLGGKAYAIKYPPNSVILKQGDTPNNIYFVAKGSVRLVRRIDKDKAITPSISSNPILMGILKTTPKKPLIQVDIIDEGGQFADYEVMMHENMINSVITTLPSLIIYLPFFEVLESLSMEEFASIKMNIKKFPENDALMEKFLENQAWKKFKSNLVNSVFFEKKNRDVTKPVVRKNSKDLSKVPILDDLKNAVETTGVMNKLYRKEQYRTGSNKKSDGEKNRMGRDKKSLNASLPYLNKRNSVAVNSMVSPKLQTRIDMDMMKATKDRIKLSIGGSQEVLENSTTSSIKNQGQKRLPLLLPTSNGYVGKFLGWPKQMTSEDREEEISRKARAMYEIIEKNSEKDKKEAKK